MAQERDSRVTKAFTAMKNIGIGAQTVKPVLKRLLKLYNRNWTLIEEDNYRTLADAIFEYENDKMIQDNAAMNVNDGLEPPFKEPNLTLYEDQTSSIKDNGSRRLDLEEGEIPLDASRQELMESSQIIGSQKECLQMHNVEKDRNKRVRSSGSSNSLNLAAAHQQPVSHDKRRALHKIHDITNGNEKVSISLLDEIGNEHLPSFVYIPQNIVYQSAYVHVSLARIADEDCCASCAGDCLSSSVPCACARDTGGDFAYTQEGLLKEEFLGACISMNEEPQKHYHFYCPDCPLERAKNAYRPQKCKGHLVRKFVKECWRKCRCGMQCGNRVVQRGITHKLQVFLTDEGKGWGLRSLEELPKGAFICEYVGEILTNMELYERNKQNSSIDKHTYPVLLDADWGSEGVLKDEDALCLDATYYGNVARFINHRCFDANLLDIPVEVETPDHHYYHLAFFTKRKVHALEELTWDYGIDFNDRNHPIEAFRCCCGSAYCRDGKGKRAKPSTSN